MCDRFGLALDDHRFHSQTNTEAEQRGHAVCDTRDGSSPLEFLSFFEHQKFGNQLWLSSRTEEQQHRIPEEVGSRVVPYQHQVARFGNIDGRKGFDPAAREFYRGKKYKD